MDVRESRQPTFTPNDDADLGFVSPSAIREATVLKVGPNDTVLFTVPADEDIAHPRWVRWSRELKEKMGVRAVIFVSEGVTPTVISPQEG